MMPSRAMFYLLAVFALLAVPSAGAVSLCHQTHSLPARTDGQISSRIDALIELQIRIQQNAFPDPTQFEFTRNYLESERASLAQVIPDFEQIYKERYLNSITLVKQAHRKKLTQNQIQGQQRDDIIRGTRVLVSENMKIPHNQRVSVTQPSPKGDLIATGTEDGDFKITDVASGKSQFANRAATKVDSIAFTPDQKFVLVAWGFSGVKIIDVDSRTIVHTLKDLQYVLDAVSSPKGNFFAVASKDKTVRIIRTSSGKVVRTIPHPKSVTSLDISPNGQLIVTTCEDHIIRIFKASTGKLLHEIPFTEDANSARFSPDGQFIVAAGDQKAQLVHVASGMLLFPSIDHEYANRWAVHSPDGRYFVTASRDGIANIVDANSLEVLHQIKHQDGPLKHWVRTARFSPDSRFVITASDDKTAQLVEVESGQVLHVFKDLPSMTKDAGFSADGKYIFLTAYETVLVFNFNQSIAD